MYWSVSLAACTGKCAGITVVLASVPILLLYWLVCRYYCCTGSVPVLLLYWCVLASVPVLLLYWLVYNSNITVVLASVPVLL